MCDICPYTHRHDWAYLLSDVGKAGSLPPRGESANVWRHRWLDSATIIYRLECCREHGFSSDNSSHWMWHGQQSTHNVVWKQFPTASPSIGFLLNVASLDLQKASSLAQKKEKKKAVWQQTKLCRTRCHSSSDLFLFSLSRLMISLDLQGWIRTGVIHGHFNITCT